MDRVQQAKISLDDGDKLVKQGPGRLVTTTTDRLALAQADYARANALATLAVVDELRALRASLEGRAG